MRLAPLVLAACTAGKPYPSSDTASPTDTASPIAAPTEPPGAVWWGVQIQNHLGQSVTTVGGSVVLAMPGSGQVLDDPATAWVGLATPPYTGEAVRHDVYDNVIEDPEKIGEENWFLLGTELLSPGDITGDGGLDLMVFASQRDQNYGPTGYLVDSTRLWTDSIFIPDPTLTTFERALRGTPCGDITGDGTTDLCLDIGIVPGPVVFGALPTVTWSPAVPIEAIRLAADDLDSDGKMELLVWDPPAATVRKLAAPPPGDYELAELAEASFQAQGTECHALVTGGDLDADGNPDFAVAVDDTVFVVTHTDTDAPLDSAHATLTFRADALAIADLDADGVSELVVGGEDEVRVFYGPIASSPLSLDDAAYLWRGSYYPDDGFGTALHAADADLDGYADLLIGAPDGNWWVGCLWWVPGPLLRP